LKKFLSFGLALGVKVTELKRGKKSLHPCFVSFLEILCCCNIEVGFVAIGFDEKARKNMKNIY